MEKEVKHNTIFDDVFRTMVQKMPQLLIPVINEVFQTNYSEDDCFQQLRNEHEEQFGKVITDSILQIQNKMYHLECQSTDDDTMAIRMIEYDFAIALEQTLKNGKPYEMNFPHSCVLYLRCNRRTPEELSIKVHLADGNSFLYRIPIIKFQQYTKDIIFQKKLLFFLPYYIIRYEKQLSCICMDEQKQKMLLNEYEEIRNTLEKQLYTKGKASLYTDLISLIIKISDYMIKSESVKERLSDIMGGNILELETERLLREGREEGRAEGQEKGRAEGALNAMIAMYRNGKISAEEAGEFLAMTTEEFMREEQNYIREKSS